MSESKPVRGVSAELRAAARGLRRDGTPAEAVLWEALRSNRLDGLKFRRQHAVGRFVQDFYCPAHKLVVELDGGIHDQQAERDADRTSALAAHGCRVLRFRNEEVFDDLPNVLNRIRASIESSSNPLPELGEGGEPKRAG
ncbi:MAG TPA: DUF559 domain-containing protein [Longimicrobiaceae bacterium]|jgi:very-short-patch-repair endonuclease